jgi:acyl carrier protein
MDRDQIVEKVRSVLERELKHNRFEMKDELTAPEVEGWDSLTHMAIISGLEESFHVRFKLKELNKLRNMGTLIELIQSKL